MIAYCWHVTLHSGALGLILYLWVRRVGIRSGQTRRRLLALLLVLPLFTAAVSWDATGLLAIPLPAGLHVAHIMAAGGVVMVFVTIWQELRPARPPRPREGPPAPEGFITTVRARRGWEHCVVSVTPADGVEVATHGRPGRPRLIVSQGALATLSHEEMQAVLDHEHAHWQEGRWWRIHALFVVRLLQSFNPVALWAFREYCSEVEIACDAAAVAGRNPKLLARVLLRVYQSTDPRDVAGRSTLRKRIDVLLERGPDKATPPLWTRSAIANLVVITGGVLLVFRTVLAVTPVVFPDTRQGPRAVSRLEDVSAELGFAPILPAYRPAILGDHAGEMTVWRNPVPAFQITWRGSEHDLTLKQRRGGPSPALPPLARPVTGVPEAMWWTSGGRNHLVVARGRFWIELETSLPLSELRRFVDTLTVY